MIIYVHQIFILLITQLAFTYSKSATETLEKGMNYFQISWRKKTSQPRQWQRSGVFIVDFEHLSHLLPSIFIADFGKDNWMNDDF